MRTYIRRPKRFKAFRWDGSIKSIEKNLSMKDIKNYFNIEANREYGQSKFSLHFNQLVSEMIDFELRQHHYNKPITKGDYIAKIGHGFKVLNPATFYRDYKEV